MSLDITKPTDSALVSELPSYIRENRAELNSIEYELDSICSLPKNPCVLPDSYLEFDMSAYDSETLTLGKDINLEVGDILKIGLGTEVEWVEVTDNSSAPTYSIVRDKASQYEPDSNPEWERGTIVINYGQPNSGGICSEVSGDEAPHIAIFTHDGEPWNSTNVIVREGNLKNYGYCADTKYGWSSFIDDDNYLTIDSSGVRLSGRVTGRLEVGKLGAHLIPDAKVNFETLDAPSACTATAVNTTVGNIENGSYHYKVTFVTETGETELGEISNEVTVDDTHKQVELTNIPIGPYDYVIKRNIYRTSVWVPTVYYYLDTIDDNVTHTYTDNISSSNLGYLCDTDYNSAHGKFFVGDKVIFDVEDDIYIGKDAGKNSLAHKNVFIGKSSGQSNTEGFANTFIGCLTGISNEDGSCNVFVGTSSGESNTSGKENVFIGGYSGQDNTLGESNTFVGFAAGFVNISGSNNVLLGGYAGYGVALGDDNVYVGVETGYGLDNGYRNIFLGPYAGNQSLDGVSDTLIIDNRIRNAGDQCSKSIIYGEMAEQPEDQVLNLNASTTVIQDLTLALGATVNEFSTDGTLAGNSDEAVPTEKAVKSYVDSNSGTSVAFLAVKTSAQNDIPVGSWIDVVINEEVYDLGNNFSSSTFTAPATGKYHFDIGIQLRDIDIDATHYSIRLNTSNRAYYNYIDPNFSADLGYSFMCLSVDADMDANDTANVQICQTGGVQQTDISANSTTTVETWFSGHQIA